MDDYYSKINKMQQKEEDNQRDIQQIQVIESKYAGRFKCPICHLQVYRP
jgi:hypothetical protein